MGCKVRNIGTGDDTTWPPGTPGDRGSCAGKTPRTVGDAPRTVGDAARTVGDAARIVGDAARRTGDPGIGPRDTDRAAVDRIDGPAAGTDGLRAASIRRTGSAGERIPRGGASPTFPVAALGPACGCGGGGDRARLAAGGITETP